MQKRVLLPIAVPTSSPIPTGSEALELHPKHSLLLQKVFMSFLENTIASRGLIIQKVHTSALTRCSCLERE
jgi:hypothetical protein